MPERAIMAFKGWPKINIITDAGEKVSAITPLIISASRSTDIPAFYGSWFMNRLNAGYVKWINPWSGRPMYVSFANVRLFVFWSKNPGPFIPCLKELDRRGLGYYFQVTLNDYGAEGLEKGVPPLSYRIETFKRLAGMIGDERVLWRFDPLVRTDTLTPDRLGERIFRLGRSLSGSTERCTVSFLAGYKKVLSNLARSGVRILEWDAAGRSAVLNILVRMGREFNMSVVSCAGADGMQAGGTGRGKCIDDELIVRLFGRDEKLMEFFGSGTGSEGCLRTRLKDRGQRPECNCIVSKDIGSYNTCGHQCVYCYANRSPERGLENSLNLDDRSDSIKGG
jgi:hypothetical protein